MSINRINFVSLPVVDQDRALAFYRDVMGFDVHTDAPYGENYRWIFLNLPGAETRLHFARETEVKYTDVPALCLVCDSVDDEAVRLGEAGTEISNGPDDAPWAPGARWLMVRDPENNLILLESFKEQEA